MITANNYTIFGIHNNAERYSWAAYHLFVLLSSLIGDTLVLYASFHDAFKLNKFIATMIHHIAISDLTYAICDVFPGTVSLIANSWVLGDAACYARVYISAFSYTVGMSFIAVLTTSKFLLLKYPIRSAYWTKKMAQWVCAAVIFAQVALPITMVLLMEKEDVAFDYRTYTCTYRYTSSLWKKLTPMFAVMYLFIPNIIIVSTTIPTLRYLAHARKSAQRVQGSTPWQGALTVALTAVFYCISTLPISVYYVGKSFVKEDVTGTFNFHLYRIAIFTTLLNIMSNFYIYTLTIRSFRKFLLSKICSVQVLQISSRNFTSTQVRIHNT